MVVPSLGLGGLALLGELEHGVVRALGLLMLLLADVLLVELGKRNPAAAHAHHQRVFLKSKEEEDDDHDDHDHDDGEQEERG